MDIFVIHFLHSFIMLLIFVIIQLQKKNIGTNVTSLQWVQMYRNGITHNFVQFGLFYLPLIDLLQLYGGKNMINFGQNGSNIF